MAEWRLDILVPLLLAGTAYGVGWVRLSRRSAGGLVYWRGASWLCGVLGIAVALLSPLAALAESLFLAHMIQHMLLMMVAPPLLLLGDPFPVILWALPRGARQRAGDLFVPGARLRAVLKGLTWTPVAWLVSTLTIWLWHLPAVYDAALQNRSLHDLEHLAFVGAGLLFWWPVINPAPHVREQVPHAHRVAYLVLGAFQNAVLGLLLTMSPWVLYPSNAIAAPVWELGALEDQAWGGVIMWGVGGAIDMFAVLLLLFKYFVTVEADVSPSGVSTS